MRHLAALIAGLLLSLGAIGSPTLVRAQADSTEVTGPNAEERLALAHRFVAAMQVDQMPAMIGQMTADLSSEMSKDSGFADPRAYERAIASATHRLTERLFEAMAPLYADIFTLEELQALVAFYESDIGRSAMGRAYEAAPRMAALMTELMPTLSLNLVVDMCAELKCTPEQLREAKAAVGETQTDD